MPLSHGRWFHLCDYQSLRLSGGLKWAPHHVFRPFTQNGGKKDDIAFCIIKCRAYYQLCECTIITKLRVLGANISKLPIVHSVASTSLLVISIMSYRQLNSTHFIRMSSVPQETTICWIMLTPKLWKITESFHPPTSSNLIWSIPVCTPQVQLHHQMCEVFSEVCKSVARGSRLFSTATNQALWKWNSLSQTNFQSLNKIKRVLFEMGCTPVISIVWCKLLWKTVLGQSFSRLDVLIKIKRV